MTESFVIKIKNMTNLVLLTVFSIRKATKMECRHPRCTYLLAIELAGWVMFDTWTARWTCKTQHTHAVRSYANYYNTYNKEGRKCLFNDALNTFYFMVIWRQTYGKGPQISEREDTRCRHIGYSFRSTVRVLLYAPSHRQDCTYHSLCYTSRGALATYNKGLRSVDSWMFLYQHPYMSLTQESHKTQAIHPHLTVYPHINFLLSLWKTASFTGYIPPNKIP